PCGPAELSDRRTHRPDGPDQRPAERQAAGRDRAVPEGTPIAAPACLSWTRRRQDRRSETEGPRGTRSHRDAGGGRRYADGEIPGCWRQSDQRDAEPCQVVHLFWGNDERRRSGTRSEPRIGQYNIRWAIDRLRKKQFVPQQLLRDCFFGPKIPHNRVQILGI